MTLDVDLRRRLLLDMIRIRMVEERIVDLYPEQEMRCPVHLSIGQEAAAVGVCSVLDREDWVFSGHRNHAHYLAKGVTSSGCWPNSTARPPDVVAVRAVRCT